MRHYNVYAGGPDRKDMVAQVSTRRQALMEMAIWGAEGYAVNVVRIDPTIMPPSLIIARCDVQEGD